jgi:hypothetical protein
VIELLNELIDELEGIEAQIAHQAVEHIHANEVGGGRLCAWGSKPRRLPRREGHWEVLELGRRRTRCACNGLGYSPPGQAHTRRSHPLALIHPAPRSF